MSLQDPEKKMSKSDKNLNNIIAILDSADIVKRKIKRAVTVSGSYDVYESQVKFGLRSSVDATVFDKVYNHYWRVVCSPSPESLPCFRSVTSEDIPSK